jgi:hypothetical protein
MKPTLGVLMVLGILAAAPPAVACRWFGTQIECDLGASRAVIGTQAAAEPTHVRPFRPQSFHGDDELVDRGATAGRPFELELQDIGADPRLCRKIGNETYCY